MQMTSPIVRQRFASLIEREDHEIDLALAALLIAQEEYPAMDPGNYLSRLDGLARQAREEAVKARSIHDVIGVINHVLFDVEGLRGNAENYYDPRNSFLNDILDRKLGIPISLSIVYIAVGRRLGLPVVGIGLPGHFIVAIEADEQILIDPFYRGTILTVADCAARIRQVYGDRLTFHPRMLTPVTSRQILVRVLTNLKAIYSQVNDRGRLLATIDRLLLLNPGEVQELRDRGIVCQQIGFYAQAIADLQRYVELAPHASDVDNIRATLRSIQGALAWKN
jgi:regulator of sirC expression with transglutaminase-like and TPR domain